MKIDTAMLMRALRVRNRTEAAFKAEKLLVAMEQEKTHIGPVSGIKAVFPINRHRAEWTSPSAQGQSSALDHFGPGLRFF